MSSKWKYLEWDSKISNDKSRHQTVRPQKCSLFLVQMEIHETSNELYILFSFRYNFITLMVSSSFEGNKYIDSFPTSGQFRYWYQEESYCVRDGRSWGVRGQPRTYYSTLACQKGYNDPGILWWPEAFWKQVFVIQHFNLNC